MSSNGAGMTQGPEQKAWEWEFRSASELRIALEEYTEYNMALGAPSAGGDPDPTVRDRAYRIFAQNREIDLGMRDLLWTDRPAWRAINFYYRQGFWSEFRGWVVPARAVGLAVPICMGPMRCQVPGDDRIELKICTRGKDCADYRSVFEERLTGYVEALRLAIESRQGRTCALPVDSTHGGC